MSNRILSLTQPAVSSTNFETFQISAELTDLRNFKSKTSADINILTRLGLGNSTLNHTADPETPKTISQPATQSKLSQFGFESGVHLSNWKLEANYSSKILWFDENVVVAELLIDKEEAIYEQREFRRASLFQDLSLEVGALFKTCLYSRRHEERMEIKYNPGLVCKSDFPEFDFYANFKDLNFKKPIA